MTLATEVVACFLAKPLGFSCR